MNRHDKERMRLIVSLSACKNTEKMEKIITLGHNQMLLRIDWLNVHNPEVDWSTPSLQFTCCPKHCSKNASQLTIRWTAKAKKPPVAWPKPEIDKNGLSKGLKPDYIKPFQHLFEKKNFDKLPIRREWDHEINLTEDVPASIPAWLYWMTPVEQEAINQFVEDELKAEKIRESKSPYVSPRFFITKKDGSRCLVQDYRKINAFTVKDKTPLPWIDDLLDVLEDGKLFTKMDIIWGYNNVCIKEGHEWKAAFQLTRNLYAHDADHFPWYDLTMEMCHLHGRSYLQRQD